MFVKTVLILGAGASQPYKYPVASKLTIDIADRICTKTGSQNESPSIFALNLKEMGFGQDLIDEFGYKLRRIAGRSIDFFLEKQRKYLEIGKAAITLRLAENENEDTLFTTHNWYDLLVDRLGDPASDLSRNHLAIITFNYDRSLEHFLFNYLINTFDLQDGEASEAVAKIPIIHVYGQIGTLPWQGGASRPYTIMGNDAPIDHKALMESSEKQIKILHEGSHTSDEFKIARRMIGNADRVYFLGFGYHGENMERLGPIKDAEDHSKIVIGTATGYSGKSFERLQKKNSLFTLFNRSNCLHLFTEHVEI